MAGRDGGNIIIYVSKNRYFITYCKWRDIHIIKMPEKHPYSVYYAIREAGHGYMTGRKTTAAPPQQSHATARDKSAGTPERG